APYTDSPIFPQKTLIIFDEIQECNKALNTLKYFCESAPQYCIIAAGSLLGVSLSQDDSFPVGKVEFVQIYPVSFKEFLAAESHELFDSVERINKIEPISAIVFNKLQQVYHKYQISGGMPAAASASLDNLGTLEIEGQLQKILNAYALDFAKHSPSKNIPKITAIWKSIPSQLSKENRKFVYKLVRAGARAREYEDALLWLEHAGLIARVFENTKPFLPLSAYDDLTAFKIYLSDIGLLRKLAKLPADAVAGSDLFMEFKGALAENFVLQSLLADFEVIPRYWASGGKAEIDFLLQYNTDIIPIEVKSAYQTIGKSLTEYNKTYSPKYRIRYSLNNLKADDNLINIPIFLADWTKKLLLIMKR
ncbi:MAG: DUF4143 domain-containing protein, partial [Endomicrobium sp.]|nr:DUF4143 domain-containing protein [Endomicrobium sp.]